jgi:hypothetical protein
MLNIFYMYIKLWLCLEHMSCHRSFNNSILILITLIHVNYNTSMLLKVPHIFGDVGTDNLLQKSILTNLQQSQLRSGHLLLTHEYKIFLFKKNIAILEIYKS